MPEPAANRAIVEFLTNRGYSQADIEKILAKLASYDEQTVNDAVFDSIGHGTFTLDEIIRQALTEET
jgi:hypothetical protein